MTNAAAKIISEKTSYKGYKNVKILELQIKSLKDGKYIEQIASREVYCVGKTAFCLLYKVNTDEILLCHQFRAGAFEAGKKNPFMLECCGGAVGERETPEESAIRETLEETGCKVLETEHIGTFHPSSNVSSETAHFYCGLIDEAKGGFYGLEEEIQTQLFDAKHLIQMLDDNKIGDAKTAICLHWFARNHKRLKEKWTPKNK